MGTSLDRKGDNTVAICCLRDTGPWCVLCRSRRCLADTEDISPFLDLLFEVLIIQRFVTVLYVIGPWLRLKKESSYVLGTVPKLEPGTSSVETREGSTDHVSLHHQTAGPVCKN